MNNITALSHPAYTAEPQGRTVDHNHVPTSYYYRATPVPAMEHSSGPMSHLDASARQANDGVAHSSPVTYLHPNMQTAQAPIPMQYSHTLQNVRPSSNLGPPDSAVHPIQLTSRSTPHSHFFISPRSSHLVLPRDEVYGNAYIHRLDSGPG